MTEAEALIRVLHRSEERIAQLERAVRDAEQGADAAQSRYYTENRMRCHVSAAAIHLLKALNAGGPAEVERGALDAALAQNAAENKERDAP